MQISLNTVTSLMSAIEAPKQRPVDIAPHPEYKSNKVHSLSDSLILYNPSSATLLSLAQALDPDSLEIVEVSLSILAVSLSILEGSVSIRANHNQH
jgi:hypothetical protein